MGGHRSLELYVLLSAVTSAPASRGCKACLIRTVTLVEKTLSVVLSACILQAQLALASASRACCSCTRRWSLHLPPAVPVLVRMGWEMGSVPPVTQQICCGAAVGCRVGRISPPSPLGSLVVFQALVIPERNLITGLLCQSLLCSFSFVCFKRPFLRFRGHTGLCLTFPLPWTPPHYPLGVAFVRCCLRRQILSTAREARISCWYLLD